MAKVSISEAARLTGKSRTTLHRLIKAGELSTCRGERNAKMLDTSELLRVFGAFAPVPVEQRGEQVSGQRDTVTSDRNEQVIYILKQEIEHLNTLLASKDSHIDSLKQAMLLLENREDQRPCEATTLVLRMYCGKRLRKKKASCFRRCRMPGKKPERSWKNRGRH
ncbi:helix-turn-helix transcriptional regulator [Klebsiella pneumoniae]|uniref:helix-turn-helix transcriptional regulator n=1 Tax=Klebsiella pneumoniae TaxID=573 RepID=UPI003EE0AADC